MAGVFYLTYMTVRYIMCTFAKKTQQKLRALLYYTLLGACTTHTIFGEPYLNGMFP
jgi:hypothetical protein